MSDQCLRPFSGCHNMRYRHPTVMVKYTPAECMSATSRVTRACRTICEHDDAQACEQAALEEELGRRLARRRVRRKLEEDRHWEARESWGLRTGRLMAATARAVCVGRQGACTAAQGSNV